MNPVDAAAAREFQRRSMAGESLDADAIYAVAAREAFGEEPRASVPARQSSQGPVSVDPEDFRLGKTELEPIEFRSRTGSPADVIGAMRSENRELAERAYDERAAERGRRALRPPTAPEQAAQDQADLAARIAADRDRPGSRDEEPQPPRYPRQWSRTLPARDQLSSFDIQRGTPETLEESFQRGVLDDETADRMRALAEAEHFANARTRDAVAMADAERHSIEAERERRAKVRASAVREMEQRVEALNEDVRNFKIEKPSLWKGKNAGETILGVIGLTLVGAAGGKDDNTVLELIKDTLDRQMQTQREDLAKRRGDVADASSLLGMARQRFDDEAIAEDAARQAALDIIGREMERMADAAQDPVRRERMYQQIALLRQEQHALGVQIRRDGADKRGERWQHIPERTISGGGPPSLAQQTKALQAQSANIEARQKLAGLMGGGGADVTSAATDPLSVPGYGKARSTKDADASKAVVVATSEVDRGLRELETLAEDPFVHVPGSKAWKRARVVRQTLGPGIAKQLAAGFNPSEAQDRKSEEMIPDPRYSSAETVKLKSGEVRSWGQRQRDAVLGQNIVGYSGASKRRERIK